MPIIRCTLSVDGKLIPTGVELEPGDTVHFKLDRAVPVDRHSSAEVKVKHPIFLGQIFVQGEPTGLQIDLPSESVQILYNPPPPPPNIVKIVVQGANQAVAAG